MKVVGLFTVSDLLYFIYYMLPKEFMCNWVFKNLKHSEINLSSTGSDKTPRQHTDNYNSTVKMS